MLRRRKILGISKEILVHIFLIFVVIAIVFPFVWMFFAALKPSSEVLSWPPVILPKHPTMDNFIKVFTKWPFARFFFNSIFVASVATLSILITSSAAGYVFAKIKFPGRDLIFYVILARAIVPIQGYLTYALLTNS